MVATPLLICRQNLFNIHFGDLPKNINNIVGNKLWKNGQFLKKRKAFGNGDFGNVGIFCLQEQIIHNKQVIALKIQEFLSHPAAKLN